MDSSSKFETPEDELKFYVQKIADYKIEIENTYEEYKDYHKGVTDMRNELHGYIYELEKSVTYYQGVLTSCLTQNIELKIELEALRVNAERVNSVRRDASRVNTPTVNTSSIL